MNELTKTNNSVVETWQTDPYIHLFSGRRYYYNDPERNDVILEDLLWGISNIPRFTGQAGKDYDVLRHSWVCWKVALIDSPNSWDFPIGCMFHDLTEGVMGDVNSPLKKMLPDYRKLYNTHEKFLIERFKLPNWVEIDKVKITDRFVGDVEGEYFLKGWEPWHGAKEPRVAKMREVVRDLIAESIITSTEDLIQEFIRQYEAHTGVYDANGVVTE